MSDSLSPVIDTSFCSKGLLLTCTVFAFICFDKEELSSREQLKQT